MGRVGSESHFQKELQKQKVHCKKILAYAVKIYKTINIIYIIY